MSPVHDLDELPLVLSVKQVARTLNVSDKTVYQIIQREELPAVKVGARQAIRVTRPALEQYLGLTEANHQAMSPIELTKKI